MEGFPGAGRERLHLSLTGAASFFEATVQFSWLRAKADAGHWMSRISYLYDVNGLVIDAQMNSFDTSESALCHQHIPFVKKGDVVLFDRYYTSFQRMFLLRAKGAHFIFRMKDNWWKCVEQFLETGL